MVGRVVAPATAVTAALYYFGYVREQAAFRYFGVDLSSVGFSTTDYVVRSAGTVFLPLAVLVVAALGALAVHNVLADVLIRPGARHGVLAGRALLALSVALLVLGVVGLARRSNAIGSPLLAPLALGGGAVLLEYTASVGTVRRDGRAVLTPAPVRRGLLVVLALVAAFWATADIALERGTAVAEAIEVSLPLQPQVVVYSKGRLQIADAQAVRLPSADALYRYRYNGLRPLIHANHFWFLLPAAWTHDNGMRVIVLADSEPGIRIELGP
jgi:hypothetical protein